MKTTNSRNSGEVSSPRLTPAWGWLNRPRHCIPQLRPHEGLGTVIEGFLDGDDDAVRAAALAGLGYADPGALSGAHISAIVHPDGLEAGRARRELVDLHIHVGGAVAPHVLWSIAHDQGFKLPVSDYWEFKELVSARPGKVKSLDEYLAVLHTWTERIQSSPQAMERAAGEAREAFEAATRGAGIDASWLAMHGLYQLAALISRSAAARASLVISAPASMRAISSRRRSDASSVTRVATRFPFSSASLVMR